MRMVAVEGRLSGVELPGGNVPEAVPAEATADCVI